MTAPDDSLHPLLVLVPAYNEAGSLAAVVTDVRIHLPSADILIVDDASTDETASLLPRLGVKWVRLSDRLGPGAAVRTGLRFALSLGYRTIVRVDGDGQHPASAVCQLLEPLREGTTDVVIGSRFLAGPAAPVPVGRRLLLRLLGHVLTLLTGRRVTDPTSGLWAFGPRALRLLAEHHPSGYPEPELLLFLSRNGVEVTEVPVQMRPRLVGRTSLTPQRTGAAMARLLLLLVIVPLRAAVGGRDD